MNKNLKRVLSLSMAAATLLSCAACGSKGSDGKTNDGSAEKTELNIRIPDSFSTVDPHNWSLDSDFRLCYQIYEPLYRVDDDTNEIPVLATGYTVSDDGLAYTFQLRDDAVFTNGEKMTADDVKFSIDRARASSYVPGDYVTTVSSVDADNEANTVTVNLSKPTPGLIEGLSYVLIVNQKFVEENQDENGLLGFNACGTGPYMMKDHVQDVSVTMEANPEYRDGEPAIKTLNFKLVTDENTALTAFQAGELDISRFNTANWDVLKDNDAYKTEELTANHVSYLVINVNQPPFDNVLVRQAIACALNKDDIITMSIDGLATPADTLVTPMMVGYGEITPAYTYDVDRAKELLAEAGYPDGLDIGEIQALSGTYFEDMALVAQQELAEVGITCTVSGLEANTLISNCMTGSFGMATMGQTNSYDMSWLSTYYASENIGSLNMSMYSNPDIDAKLAEANTCMDPEKRIALYQEILTTVDTDCPYIPLFNKTLCMAWSSDLSYTPTVRMESYANCSWN